RSDRDWSSDVCSSDLEFVSAFADRGSSVLELGSSTGMAASILSDAGYATTATDVCHRFFRTDLRSPTLRFTGADNTQLPFADGRSEERRVGKECRWRW